MLAMATRATLCVFLLLGVAAAGPLDRKTTKTLEKFGEKWWKARPPHKFKLWKRADHQGLLAEARQLGEMPEGALAPTVAAFWKTLKKHGPKARKAKGRLYIEGHGYVSQYTKNEMWAAVKGGGKNKGLIIGLHGGGEGAGSADTGWPMKGCMGIYPQGLLIHGDNWNRVHGEKQILSLIEVAKAQYDIDPDRVYVGGFSMGGTGSWHMAARFPDLLAGAAPHNGVIMAQPKSQLQTPEEVAAIQPGLIPNVANLPMFFCTGGIDRNCRPGTFLYAWNEVQKLRAEHEELYEHIRFEYFEKLAHVYGPGLPSRALKYLAERKRDTFPKQIVWEFAQDPFPVPDQKDTTGRFYKNSMYWLYHPEPDDGMILKAQREGNTIKIDCAFTTTGLTVFLNPEMIDVTKDVVVMLNEKEAYRGKPKPDFATVIETLDLNLDKRLVFDRRVVLAE